jgi:WD40 repeat protein
MLTMPRRFVPTRPAALILTLALLALPVTPLQPPDNKQDSALPYIYYYADTLNSLVIERVDGSDSQVLAELPPENSLFTSFNWSPSGKWVAWRNGQWNGPAYVKFTPWVMRGDGSERRHLPDETHDVVFMRWSPTDDVLFVVDEPRGIQTVKMMLWDVPSGALLAQFTYDNLAAADYLSYAQYGWEADGQYAYAVVPTYDTQTLIILSRNGAIESFVFGENWAHDLGDFTRGRALYIAQRQEDSYEPRLIMQDLASSREVVVLTDDREVEGDAYWNDQLTHAILQLVWRSDDNRIVRTEYHALNWVDETVIPLPDALSVRLSSDHGNSPYRLWSSDGQFAALREGENGLAVLNAQTGDVHTIGIENIVGWYWSTSDPALWIQSTGSMAYRYEPESQELVRVPAFDGGSEYSRYQSSPDGTIVARLPGVLGPLVNVETGKKIPFIHHSLAQAGMHLNGVAWHASGDWYMTGEIIFYAGGGNGPEAITLYSRDGTLRRELGKCFSLGSCADFVPERAVPYLRSGQTQPVVVEPVLTLKHDKLIETVAWSPTENLLAAYGLSSPPSEGEATLTIWRVAGNEAHQVETFPVDIVCDYYPGSCLMMWRDDDTIVFDNRHDAAWVLDLTTHEAHSIPKTSHKISPDGLYRVELSEGKLEIVDIERDIVAVKAEREEDVNSGFRLWHWLSEGHTLLVQRYDGRILRWDGADIRPIGSGALMWGYAYHERTDLLATGSLYSRVSIIDTAAGEHLADINWASSALAFNADGTLLAAGGTELVSIWDMTRYRH